MAADTTNGSAMRIAPTMTAAIPRRLPLPEGPASFCNLVPAFPCVGCSPTSLWVPAGARQLAVVRAIRWARTPDCEEYYPEGGTATPPNYLRKHSNGGFRCARATKGGVPGRDHRPVKTAGRARAREGPRRSAPFATERIDDERLVDRCPDCIRAPSGTSVHAHPIGPDDYAG